MLKNRSLLHLRNAGIRLLVGPESGLPHLRVAGIHLLIGPISVMLRQRLDVIRRAMRIEEALKAKDANVPFVIGFQVTC